MARKAKQSPLKDIRDVTIREADIIAYRGHADLLVARVQKLDLEGRTILAQRLQNGSPGNFVTIRSMKNVAVVNADVR